MRAATERLVVLGEDQDLHETVVRSPSLDLGDGKLGILGGDDDRASQPRFPVEPFPCQPFVGGAAQGCSHVV